MKTKNPYLALLLLLTCFAAAPRVHAVSPAPDGGYPGNNTAEGQSALLSLTTGINNTALGWFSLKSNLNGQLNTAVGSGTLYSANSNSNTAIGGAALFSDTTGTAIQRLEPWRSGATPTASQTQPLVTIRF